MDDRYAQTYQEEAREILQDLESTLLALNSSRQDEELIARAFRALHTIKGSGAMFGFDEVATFVHHIESAFDQVRNGILNASPDLINLTLTAVDHIRAMLDAALGRPLADAEVGNQILEDLRALTNAPDEPPVFQSANGKTRAASGLTTTTQEWHLHFRPGPDLLTCGANPLLLFRDLRHLGTLQINADCSSVPRLGEFNPEQCYLAWDMVLTTKAPYEEIRDVFIFVEDRCELRIEPSRISEVSQEQTNLPEETQAGCDAEERTRIEKQPRKGCRDVAEDSHNSSIRVPAAKLDQLVDLVGQLVTAQARLVEIAARYEDRDMQSVAEEIEGLTAALRDNSMTLRTLPLRYTFERFKRLVYDLGRTLHKDVELTFEGEETELDKSVIDQLGDPLMHLLRNSMDHGIGTIEERCAAGKKPTANIHLSASQVGHQVLISVRDDGRGIDREAVLAKAVSKGLIAADARLTESEIFSLILEPGFSTAPAITDISGRGVGMDVVRRNIEALRGTVEIASQSGIGTTITLRLPLTMAIIDGLLVRVGRTHFVMPLANTVECVELSSQDIANANGKRLAYIRGEVVPYIRLSEYMQMSTERPEIEQVMVAETEQGRFGFAVDQVLGHHQTVIKNLGRLYRNVQFLSGATILGDGTLALILDLHRLIQDELRLKPAERRLPTAPLNQQLSDNTKQIATN